jgi:amino acid permease
LSIVFIVAVAVGLQDRPASAPQDGVWVSDFKIVNNPSFTDAVTAISTFVLAYSGTPSYFNIASEMRNPRHYTRSLIVAQTSITATYIAIGCVVYYYCGSYVSSPAMGSAGGVVKKISYGIALPGLLASLIITTHVCCRFPGALVITSANNPQAPGEVHLHSSAPWYKTSDLKLARPLEYLDRLHSRYHRSGLRYRQCHSRL